MADFLHPDNEFLRKLIAIIEENLPDENFEVPDLAEKVNMSRSNLLRKVKSLSGFSVSVFIRHVRLHHAKELLKDDSLTISEVSFKVGFSSTSYFTKCFREAFGYPPGEEKKNIAEKATESVDDAGKLKAPRWSLIIVVSLTLASAMFLLFRNEPETQIAAEKSIAVLPFKNDSNDTTNVYIINGLMEAVLDNLQRIEDLQVTSRTTVEKYRNLVKTIPELSKELEVNYFVEGSGQKVGDQILLTIQLIDARNDKHLWSQQYEREAKDIFKLQMEVAKNIASEIEAVITPDEQRLIEKVPTENLVAYDYYLRGLELAKDQTGEGLLEAIQLFERAISEDDQFAHPYAYIAICHYLLDIFQANKQYGSKINTYADKAILFDSELPEGLIAKALFYMQDEQYELAVEFFEKVLKYSPNSGWVHNKLSEIYTYYLPNPKRFLRHALEGIRVAISDQDSVEASYTYLHLSSALAQTGFIGIAEKYVKKSLNYNPKNLYSEYLYSYIRLAQNFDLERTKNELIATLAKDSTRVDIMQEVAKVCFTMEEYDEAWVYYERFVETKKTLGIEVFPGADINIAFVLDQIGKENEATRYYKLFFEYVQNDQSIYQEINKSAYYAAKGDVEKGIEHLEAFTQQRDYLYWIVLFLEEDPVIRQLSTHPDFDKIIKKINENFWIGHKQTRAMLEEEGVI